MKKFAETSEIPRSTINDWLGSQKAKLSPENFAKLYKALKVTPEVLRDALEPPPSSGVVQIPIVNRPGSPPLVMPARIPVINRISATRWEERTDLGHVEGFADNYLDITHHKPFCLVCEGDCMEPDWMNGELIVFSQKIIEDSGLRDGDDVAVQLDGAGDGENTFKRASNDGEEAIILHCANPKYKERTRVEWDSIARIGRALWAIRTPKRRS